MSFLIRRATVSAAVAYAIAGAFPRLLGFVLLPFYARALSPEEFAQVAVITAVSALASTVLTFGLETAVFRTVIRLRGHPAERHTFLNSIGYFAIGAPLLVALFAAFLVWQFVPASVASAEALMLAFVAAALQATTVILPLPVLRADEKLRSYMLTTGTYGLTSGVATFIAVIVLDLGVRGWWIAALVAAACYLVAGLATVGHRWTKSVNRALLLAALTFGLPLVPHALSHWALGMSDRLVLAPLVPAAELGLYSVAYQFAMPIAILSAATSQAVMPHFARASVDTAVMHSLRPVATTQAIVIAFFGVAAALVCPSLIAVLLPESFAGAATLVPLIVLGYVFFGWYLVPMNVLSLVVGKTRWVWTATGIAALSNVVLNLLLVPRLGVIAAALNTALAYGILLLLVYVHASRELAQSIPIDWRALVGALGILAVAYLMAATLTSPGDLIGLVSRSIIVLATGACLVLYAARFGTTHSIVARET